MLVRSKLLRDVPHGFTTRYGGVSQGPLDSLNLARRPGETDERLVENWSRVAAALGRGAEDLVLLSQVHGRAVLRVERASGPLACAGEADGLVTREPGLVLAARAADCVPVLLAGPRRDGGVPAVGAVHSGWRGTVQDVVGAAVASLCAEAGCPAAELRAVVGPCIGLDAYEVGEEVASELEAAGLGECVERRAGARPHADLGAAVELQLRRAGVGATE
ncbi:MAG TPA: hypothetical protein DEA08_13315, partial [Planctomycetes bacterium]|nr:hypothetical protein [Planctomycetota bacterium]